jgi:toxin ParE1/3/4
MDIMRDFITIIQYLQNTSPQAAAKAFANIRDTADGLGLFPERWRIVPELLANRISHYRELIITPWRVIYRFSGNIVYVLAVIDSRRSVEDVLLDRFIKINRLR